MGPAAWQEALVVAVVLLGGAASWYASRRSAALGLALGALTVAAALALGRAWGVDLSG